MDFEFIDINITAPSIGLPVLESVTLPFNVKVLADKKVLLIKMTAVISSSNLGINVFFIF
jgi:hypothetical protein